MKHAIKKIFLFSSLTVLGLNPNAFGNPQSPQNNAPENSPGILELEDSLTATAPGTKYTMRIPKPSSKFDCKIRYVRPNPSTHYTIRNVRPELDNPFMREHGWYGGKSRPGNR